MTAEHADDLSPVPAVVVLAAGRGTRMKSRKATLLHEVCGRTLLSHAVSAAAALDPERLVVVVGHRRDQVAEHLETLPMSVTTAVQEEQLGTGHAVSVGMEGLADVAGDVVVTYGDVPMLTGDTLRKLVAIHRAQRNAITLLTAEVSEPLGYGRIVRIDGQVTGIVEEADATDEQREIREINSGIYVFDAEALRTGLVGVNVEHEGGEQQLTDVIQVAHERGDRVGALKLDDVWQTHGVNDRVQLARVSQEMNRRILDRWMLEGVTIVDPGSTWIDIDVDLAPDVLLKPGVILQGATTIGEGAVIGPDTSLMNVEVGPDAEVFRTHGSFSIIGENATVGPFSYLRPGTQLGKGGKIGTFAETKNVVVGEDAKITHLCYVGDAVIGERVNISAGVIFANYDGFQKSHSHVGDDAFVGSNSVVVAPVDIAAGAFVAAGSAITDDVPAGALAIARGRQTNKEGWVAKDRPGTRAHESATNHDGTIHGNVEESRASQAKRKG